MPEPVVIEFSQKGLEQVTDAFRQIAEESKKTSDKVSESSRKMDVSYKELAFSLSHVTTAGLALESTWKRVAEGQMTVLEGILRSIPAVISMASAVSTLTSAEALRTATTVASTLADWGHIIALQAKAIALGIVQALSGPLGWVILAGAGAAVAGVMSLAARIPSRQFGGPIERTGPYLLHAGEHVLPRGASAITINVYGAATPGETGDAVVDALRRAGVV